MDTANRPHIAPLFLVGVSVILVGAAGSLAHHGSMPAGAVWLCSILGQTQPASPVQTASGVPSWIDRLLGDSGMRTHFVVLFGMLITAADLIRRGVRQGAG